MTAIPQVKRAVDMKHGKSRLLQSVPVKETFQGAIVWERRYRKAMRKRIERLGYSPALF